MLQAGSDLIVDPHAPHAWLERVASIDKTLRVLPDHYHELLNEMDWANTLADMLDWLELRVMERNAAGGSARSRFGRLRDAGHGRGTGPHRLSLKALIHAAAVTCQIATVPRYGSAQDVSAVDSPDESSLKPRARSFWRSFSRPKRNRLLQVGRLVSIATATSDRGSPEK